MAYKLKLLIILYLLAGMVFYLLRQMYRKNGNTEALKELKRISKIWYVLISLAVLSPHIYIVFLGAILFLKKELERLPVDRLYLFYIFILTVPNISFFLSAGGAVIMELTLLRLLSVVFLLPLFIKVLSTRFKLRGVHEKSVFFLFVLLIILQFRQGSMTVGIRESLEYALDVIVPFYLIVTFVDSREALNKLLRYLFAGLAVLSLIGIFESVKGWVMYNTVYDLARYKRSGGYEYRSGFLRGLTLFSHPITFGYAMMYTMGLYLYHSHQAKKDLLQYALFGICVFGVFFSLSRGPWFGALLCYLTYIVLSRHAVKKIFQFVSFFIIGGAFLLAAGMLDKVTALLPFLAEAETHQSKTVDYRGRLFTQATIVIKRNLLFGSEDFLETPEMQTMIQGQGIVDLVNTYLIYALNYGLVGLTLFVAMFVFTALKIYRLSRRIHRYDESMFRLGNLFLALIVGVMFVISTMNTLGFIQYLYFFLIACSMAYIRISEAILKNPSEYYAPEPQAESEPRVVGSVS